MRFVALILSFAAACTVMGDAAAQSNDGADTPLGSRIRRNNQFRQDLVDPYANDRMTAVNRERRQTMLGRFGRCVFDHSREGALALLEKTDYGFVRFEQIGLDTNRGMRVYGFNDCATRLANSSNSSVMLRFNAGNLRQWLVQEAYFERYPETPAWITPGFAIAPRVYPLSPTNPGVLSAMDFADCVVAADPYNADFFYRSVGGSDDEKGAISQLMPVLGPCLTEGQQLELKPFSLRLWLGEALWHAANNSVPAPPEAQQEAE